MMRLSSNWSHAPLPEVPLQVWEKNPPDVEVNAEDVAKQEFKNKMAELQDINVKPITFAVPVSDRREATVINAVAFSLHQISSSSSADLQV